MDYRIEQIYFYYKGSIDGWYPIERYSTVLDELITNIIEDSVTRNVRDIW